MPSLLQVAYHPIQSLSVCMTPVALEIANWRKEVPTCSVRPDALFLLSALHGDHRELAASMTSWQAGTKEYTMKGLLLSVPLGKAVTHCVRAGALPQANPKVVFVPNTESESSLIDSLEVLAKHQCAICVTRGAGGSEWQLTSKGKRCAEECTAIMQTSLSFEVHNALEDMTSH